MRNFDHLSEDERAVVGDPADYDWDRSVEVAPATRSPGRTQFSMRVSETLYARLQELATAKGLNFSDVVREALTTFVEHGSASSGAMVSIGDQARVVLTATTYSLESRTKGPDVVRTRLDQVHA